VEQQGVEPWEAGGALSIWLGARWANDQLVFARAESIKGRFWLACW
jgi:hypothetical protein